MPGLGLAPASVLLKYLAKAPLRDFGLRDDACNPIPVLGPASNGLVVAAAIGFDHIADPLDQDIPARFDVHVRRASGFEALTGAHAVAPPTCAAEIVAAT